MNNSALPYWLTLFVALTATYGGYKWYQVEHAQPDGGVEISHLPPLAEFELTSQSGQPFRSADMRGKVWAASFFFSTCPGSCKRLNANIKYLAGLDSLQDVTWVSISVDPQNDTVPVLAAYAKSLNADKLNWQFVRGELPYIRRVGRDILHVDDVSYQGHRDYVVVIDRTGSIRGAYDARRYSQLERIEAKLVELLKESLPSAGVEKADRKDTKGTKEQDATS